MAYRNIQNIASALEERMLDGTPFTYGSLSAWAFVHLGYDEADRDEGRLIDRTLQKLRRAGRIQFAREGGRVVWRLSPAVMIAA